MIEDYSWEQQEQGILHSLVKLNVGSEAHIEIIPREESYLTAITIYADRDDDLEELYKESLHVEDILSLKDMYYVDLVDEQHHLFETYNYCVLIEGKASCILEGKRVADHFLIPLKERLGINNERC